MQNKQALVGIVATILILVGAGVMFALDKAKTSSQPSSIARLVSPTPVSTASATIAGIFKTTKNQKCDFDSKTADNEVKGTVYVSGNNSYAEFNTITNSKTDKMYLVRNENIFYIWGDALPQGIKMSMSVTELGQKLSSQYASFDPNQKTDVKCVDWTPDESKFSAPTNIKFLDLSAVTPSNPKVSGMQSPSSQCSLCTSMTGNAKATCLSSFNCK